MPAVDVTGIREPVSPGLHGLLRGAVLMHVSRERRRVFPPILHVGRPDGSVTTLHVGPDVVTDHALRVDAVEAMVRRTRRPGVLPLIWLTRSGDLAEVQDVDLAWSGAATTAAGELDLPLVMVVVNRTSWRDPRTGVGRHWKRLRPT